MTDLADFLLARIAEDEAVARAATPSPWVPHSQGWVDKHGDWIIVAPYEELDISDENRRHVTRWQPARVLDECNAKRRIVEFMLNEVKDARRRLGWTVPDGQVGDKGRDYRVGYENARAQQLTDALDRTDRVLRLLTLPYADHPDYRE